MSGSDFLNQSTVGDSSYTPLDNPIIQRIIQQPIYNSMEIRKMDLQKKEIF